MNNELKVFQSSEFGEVRTVIKDGEPWFVAADVCRALDHSNVTVALDRVDDDEKAKFSLGLTGGDTNCVNEPGLYTLVLGSRKPEAKAFKRWITHEVIPSIRKYGAYMTPDALYKAMATPDGIIQVLTALKDEQDKNRVLNAENILLTQEALQWDEDTFILAAVRRYGSNLNPIYGDKFAYGWYCFKRELLYKHSINLNMRKTLYLNRTGKKHVPSMLSFLSQEEKPLAVKTIIALCRESGVDISDLLANIDFSEDAA